MAGFSSYGAINTAIRTGNFQQTIFVKQSMNTGGVPMSSWYIAGISPIAATFGTALTATTCDNTTPGAVKFINAASGKYKHLLKFGLGCTSAQAGVMILVDRLLEAPFNGTVTSGTFNSGTPLAIPSRDINGAANGDGVMMFAETKDNSSAGVLTVTYTNQAGATGHSTGAIDTAGAANNILNSLYRPFMPLAAGDTGVRKIESYTLNASIGSTHCNIVLCRPLAIINVYDANTYVERDLILQHWSFPRLYDGTCMQLITPGNGNGGVMAGEILMVEA